MWHDSFEGRKGAHLLEEDDDTPVTCPLTSYVHCTHKYINKNGNQITKTKNGVNANVVPVFIHNGSYL